MLLLTSTSDSLELVTASAPSVAWQTSWVDLVTEGSPTVTPGSGQGLVSGANTTTLAAAPSVSTTRQLKSVTARNTDASVAQTVTLQKRASATAYELLRAVLQGGESLVYEDGEGFDIVNRAGVRRALAADAMTPMVLMAPHFASTNLTSTKTLTSGSSFALYVGRAPASPPTSPKVRVRVTTAAATITWAEVALATGRVTPGGNPLLTVVGWTNVSGIINSTGQKTITVAIASGQQLLPGDDVWLLVGNQATTAGVLRAASVADDLQAGYQASAAVRPSTVVGAPTPFTLESATALPAWAAVQIWERIVS